MSMPAGAGAEVTATGKPFVLLVSLVGGKPIPYPFDQGRKELNILHLNGSKIGRWGYRGELYTRLKSNAGKKMHKMVIRTILAEEYIFEP